MWSIEDVLMELKEEEEEGMKEKRRRGMAPGFRFHPTDEELITYYLASKLFNNNTSSFSPLLHIPQVDLNRCEPWDLPERAKMGEREWYFYSVRDRKYPTGLRTNRATLTGYWKATGKDRHIYKNNKQKKSNGGGDDDDDDALMIGMKKTLVFYQGRAPRGVKTSWVMHEYRLHAHFSFRISSSKEEWVICRIFHKHGVGENERKLKAMTTSYIPPPPLLDTPNTTTSPPLLPPPPLMTYFGSLPSYHPTTVAATSSANQAPQSLAVLDDPGEIFPPLLCMKQEEQEMKWLDKIIPPPQYLNHSYYYHDHHDDPTNPEAHDLEFSASLAALNTLLDDPLLPLASSSLPTQPYI